MALNTRTAPCVRESGTTMRPLAPEPELGQTVVWWWEGQADIEASLTTADREERARLRRETRVVRT